MYVFSVAALQLHYVTEDRLAVESRAKAVFEVGLTVKEEYLYRVFKAGLIVNIAKGTTDPGVDCFNQ